ncbi:hypothetical protein [Helicobacter sp.]|uniref:hypothetical protein n=1 Tax=Helicobacter sp. TaxID=218 RepID=UPI002A765EA9|nr:hypothetical protein [Helicobacter sp.]MDY2585454.1 hypothetical protein [Helicobacter sp.]
MTSKVEKTMDSYTQMSQNIQALVEKVNAILISIGANNASKIDEMLEEIKKEALKVAKNPLDDPTLQAQLNSIQTALANALKQIESQGGVDVTALKAELMTALKAELTEDLTRIVTSPSGGSVNDDEIVGDKEIEIELLHGASHNKPASTLRFLDWAEYITVHKSGARRYLKIKGFGNDTTILRTKREGEIFVYDILAHITEPIVKVIALNGNYMLVCEHSSFAYMLGLDWAMLGAFENISNPTDAVKVHFGSPIVDAHCTGDTTYVLLENGDVWASGRNPYTFGYNHNIDSNNAFTKTAFENIVSLNYVADRALDNKNGIALLDSAGNICCAGGEGRYLCSNYNTVAVHSSNIKHIAKMNGYESVWCMHNGVAANHTSSQRTYAIGLYTGHYSNAYIMQYTYESIKAKKVLQDSEKTLYLLNNNQLYYATGCYGYAPAIKYGNSVDNKPSASNNVSKIQDNVVDMATSNNRWIIKKGDNTLWTWGLNAQKYGGVSGTNSTTLAAFKIFDGADDFVCGKNFTAVLKGKTISVCRELIIGNGFSEIYTAPAKKKKPTQTTQTTQTGDR